VTRNDLEKLVQSCLDNRIPYFSLRIHGSPDCRRMRLMGAKKGPYGWISDFRGADVRVDFNTETVSRYLDYLPTYVLSGEDDIAAEIWSDK
jgi:hypothetical protein